MYQDQIIKTVNMYEVFCDECKVHPAKKLQTLIAAHYCASFSVRLLISLNMLSWV